MSRQLLIPVEEAGQRVDKLLSAALEDMTRSAVQNLIENGCVTCGGKALSKSAKLKPGDQILVELPEVRPLEVRPQPIPLEVVYEDGDLLVVNKPKGMVVHPAPGHEEGTLVNALLAHCGDSLSGINGVARPGIVHRIDKDTSGLLIVAKNDFSHTRLAEQIQAHTFTREYSAVVYGSFKEDSGTVDQPLGRHPTDRKKIAVLPNSPSARRAVTHFWVVKRFQGFTQLRLRLETGRTHQIRVHMAYLGHPVAGDPVYGPKKVSPPWRASASTRGKSALSTPAQGSIWSSRRLCPPTSPGFAKAEGSVSHGPGKQIPHGAPARGRAVTAVVLTGLYSARPLEFYQVTVEATPAPAAASSQVQPTQEPAGETIPVEEDTSSEGPQEVLVEKSVNLNTATLEELDLLPGVGPAIAQRIIDYREQNSGFYDIEEIMEVSGIGEKTFAKLEPYITVE